MQARGRAHSLRYIPCYMCASTNTSMDMNTKIQVSVGVVVVVGAHMDGWVQTCFCKCNAYSLLFNMDNKKVLALCSAPNHFS